MRQAGEVTYADAHKQRRNEGWVKFYYLIIKDYIIYKNMWMSHF